MTRNISILGFDSSLNYLKRDQDLCGSFDLQLGGFGTYATKVIDHNLGYVPFHQVGADLTNDGTIWSNDVVNEYTETSLGGYNPPYPTLDYWCTTTQLTISLYNGTSPTSTGTRKVYWAIYLDYTT